MSCRPHAREKSEEVSFGLAAYGSLVPFQYLSLGLREAIERFRHVPIRSLGTGGRADFAANVLLFVPMGYCLLAVFLVDRRSVPRTFLAVLLAAVLSGVLSVALEFSQFWFPARIPSKNDVFAQIVGTMVGMGLWLITGKAINDWARSPARSRCPEAYRDRLLQTYLAGLVIYSLQPLDLTISATELVHKYHEGRSVACAPLLSRW